MESAVEYTAKGVRKEIRKCICDRPKALVMCRVCGWTYNKGRVKQLCDLHPKTFYLMDIEFCPVCQANAKMLLEHSDTNEGDEYCDY